MVDEATLGFVEHDGAEYSRAFHERFDGEPGLRFAACRDNPYGGSREAAEESGEGALIDTAIGIDEEEQRRGTVENAG